MEPEIEERFRALEDELRRLSKEVQVLREKEDTGRNSSCGCKTK
ncbi:hypothetical protein [Methanoregula sp.]|jgi:hypothetical protein